MRLLFKLKTHLGEVGGQQVWKEEARRSGRKRRAAQSRGPATVADEKDIEFQLGPTYIYIQPTWQCLGKQFNTAALHHFHKLIEQIKILLKVFSFFPHPFLHIFLSFVRWTWTQTAVRGQDSESTEPIWDSHQKRGCRLFWQQVGDSRTHPVTALPLSQVHLLLPTSTEKPNACSIWSHTHARTHATHSLRPRPHRDDVVCANFLLLSC